MKLKSVLKSEIEISGTGLHTGEYVNIKISPAEAGLGIRFIRTDVKPEVVIIADVNNVTSTVRSTTITQGDTSVTTIEHLLAALSALDIEDVTIYIDGPEVPILDGSSVIYIEKFKEAGLTTEPSVREEFTITESFVYHDEASGAEYAVFPSSKLELTSIVSFADDNIGNMTATMNDKSEFSDRFSSARTFVLLSDVEKLFDAGLIKGGDVDNAVVIVDKTLSESEISVLRTKMNKPSLKIENNVLLTSPMRFKNEPARHKILDLLGDLCLVGRNINAKIIATKPGHTGNTALAREIKSRYLDYRKHKDVPIYDANKPALMDVEEIKTFLPHRYPFLMVDKIIELSDNHCVGIKNITFNENFFQGHFPDNPVFPGVLQMEALAQTGGILALTLAGKGDEVWDTYFLKMDNVKFKAMVVPGDVLILKMLLMAPIRRGIVQMKGTAYVGNKLVSEGELTAQIVKRTNDK